MKKIFPTSKKGSLIVDAAISIPIFVLAICSILGLVKQVAFEEKHFKELADKSRQLCAVYASSGIDPEDTQFLSLEKERLAFKAFCGLKDSEGDRLVYIFPKRGERYHIIGCSTLKAGEVETVLSDSIRRKYKACQICKPDTLPNGASVFLYTEGSGVFHKKTCATITKTYEKLRKSEAAERGYTPCRICFPDSNQSLQNSENE